MIKENIRVKKVETLGKTYGLNTMMTPTNLQDGEFQNLQNTFQYNFGALEKRKGTRYLRVDSNFNFYESDTPDTNMPAGVKNCLAFYVDEVKQEAYGVFDTEKIGQTGSCVLANVSVSATGSLVNRDIASIFAPDMGTYLWLFYLTASSLVYADKKSVGVVVSPNTAATFNYDITGTVPSGVQALLVYVGDINSPFKQIDSQPAPINGRSVNPTGPWLGYKTSSISEFNTVARTPYAFPIYGSLTRDDESNIPGLDIGVIGFKAKLSARADLSTKQFVVTITDPYEKAKYEKYKRYFLDLGVGINRYAHISYPNATAPAWTNLLSNDAKMIVNGFYYDANGDLISDLITSYVDGTAYGFSGTANEGPTDIIFSAELAVVFSTIGPTKVQRMKVESANPTEELYYISKGAHEPRRAIYYIKKGMTSWARLPLHNYRQQSTQDLARTNPVTQVTGVQPVYFSYMNRSTGFIDGYNTYPSFLYTELDQPQDIFTFVKVGENIYLPTTQRVGSSNVGDKNTYTSFMTDDSSDKTKTSKTSGLTFIMGTSVGTYSNSTLVSENTPLYSSTEKNQLNFSKNDIVTKQGFGAVNTYGNRSSSLNTFDVSSTYTMKFISFDLLKFSLSYKLGLYICSNISGMMTASTEYKSLSGPFPSTFGVSFDGRLVTSGNPASGSALYHSDAITGPSSIIKTWRPGFQEFPSIFSSNNNSSPITGLFSLARNPFAASQVNALLIFKNKSVFMITSGWDDTTATGVDANYSVSLLTDIGGAISHTAIASIKTGCVFVGDNDVYYYDIAQSSVQPLGYKVKNLFSTIRDKKFYVDATNYGINRSGCLYAYSHGNIARINFGVNCVKDPLDAEAADYYITRELWLDGRDGSGFPWHGPMVRRFNKNILINSSYFSPISNYQSFNGRIYTDNTLTDFRTGGIIGMAANDMVVLECDTYKDIGSTIESSITSPDYTFGGGSNLKCFTAINLNMESSGTGKIFAMVETGEGQYEGGNMDYVAAAAPSFDISLWDNASWADRFYGFKKIILTKKPMGRVARLTLAHRENSNFIINNMELVYKFKNRSYL